METELIQLEKRAQEIKTQQALLQQKIADTKEEQEKILAELKALGIKQEELDSVIEKLESEIKTEIDECKKLLG